MSIKQRLQEDLRRAMKDRDAPRTACIRMLRSRLQEREVELRAQQGRDYQIDDDEARVVIATYAKQRRDSIDGYRQGGRDDLVAAEQAELEIVGEYLPRPLSEPEIRALVAEAIATSGAQSVRDLGRVMKILAPQTRGVADGKRVSQLVREALEDAGPADG